MPRSRRSAPRTRRTITPEWRQHALAILDSQGRGARTVLAKAVGCKKATLSKLLSDPEYQSSDLLEPISEHLGIALPSLEVVPERMAELAAAVSDLSEAEFSLIVEFAKNFAALKARD